LPCLDVFVVRVFVVAVLVIVVDVVVFIVIGVVVWIVKNVIGHFQDTGSVAGFVFSRLGGGYVVQKWRPHVLQTQNWSGVHGMPGPGSRISIWAPQRIQRMWRTASLIAAGS
jgi:hypothetical protein